MLNNCLSKNLVHSVSAPNLEKILKTFPQTFDGLWKLNKDIQY